MARVRPHAKIHTSLGNHPKTADLYSDNDLLATYTRIMLFAIERYAAKNGDTFIVSKKEMLVLTGKGRIDAAKRVLGLLAEVSPISQRYTGDNCEITIPNFAKKQGFYSKNSTRTVKELRTPHTHTKEQEVVASSRVGEPHGEASSKRSRSQEVFFGDHPLALAHPAKSKVGSQFVGEEGNSTQEWTGPESKVEPRRH